MGAIIATIALVGLLVLSPFIRVMLLPLFKFETKVNTNEQIIQKTYDSDNVIYNYEWFKNQFEAINAIKGKINNADADITSFELSAGARSTWTFEDKTEDARLHTIATGLKNQYEDMVAQYNARAKMVNRNIFQNNLPLFIGLE